MSTQLFEKNNNQHNSMIYNPEKIELVKRTITKGSTEDEFKMFMHISEKYGLDPFLKEIWFIKRAKKQQDKNGKWDYKRLANGEIDYKDAETLIYTSRDGYLKIAQRDDNFDGILSGSIHEKDDFDFDAMNCNIKHKFAKGDRGKITGAYAIVYHKKRKPVIIFAPFNEYYDFNSTTWKKYPTAMIIKVAEVLALKRQFGISGLVTKEEMTIEEAEQNIKRIHPKVNEENVVSICLTDEIIIDSEFINKEQAREIAAKANSAGITKENILKVLTENGYAVNGLLEIKKSDFEDILNLFNLPA